MVVEWCRRSFAWLGLAAVSLTTAVVVPQLPAGAAGNGIDPAALPRGADPGVVYLVRDTIRDGDLRVPATKRGEHDALWVVAGGYVVRDYNVGKRYLVRVVFVSRNGSRRVIARSRQWIPVVVSQSGRRLAYLKPTSPTGQRAAVTVESARTGRVVARREFRLATLVAVTGHRVLLGRRLHWHHPATVWWNYRRHSVRRLYHQAAIGADVRHDKVVFNTSSVGDFCNRVAVLSRPAHTWWRSCGIYPHQWSPDGSRALATHSYFDAAGTNMWLVIQGRTAKRQAKITGRLDWQAVWEDNQHFLTMAQSDAGKAAVIRCDLTGSCERASRVWDVPVDPDLYYQPPPVVLAAN